MVTRSTRSMVTFTNAFKMGESRQELPASTYEVVVEEELLQMTTQGDLEHAIECDRTLSETTKNGEAALSPQENMT